MEEMLTAINNGSNAFGETNDCSVRALAAVTECTYAQAHEALKLAGRKNRKGANVFAQMAAAAKLGFELRALTLDELNEIRSRIGLEQVTSIYSAYRGITTKKLHQAHLQLGRLTVRVSRHVVGYIDGKIVDTSRTRARRVVEMYAVTKLGEGVVPVIQAPVPTKKVMKIISLRGVRRIIWEDVPVAA